MWLTCNKPSEKPEYYELMVFRSFVLGYHILGGGLKLFVPELDDEDHESAARSCTGEESLPPKKRRFGLRIALQFPTKKCESKDKNASKIKAGRKKMPAKRKAPTTGEKMDAESDSEGENDQPNMEDSNALLKRAMNIKENKAVLAQLLAELHSVPDLFPMKPTPPPSKQKKTSRRTFSEGPVERRTNPTRSARPPENFALETFTASAMQFAEHLQKYGKKAFHRRPLSEEEKEEIRKRRRSSKGNNYRPVEDITEDELANVADTVKDKVYDKILGNTCHQCRQKTVDTKTFCRNPGCGGVRGQFCGPCLRNRYGEDVREALLDPDWICPPCREICNCSYCRKRDGRCATGMLIHLAKFSGHDNVKEYLESLQKRLAENE
ncbi:PREDICTED: cell division cycle-associated 7-like protein [Nanorana parkeri]|uniref:cell division cycle-associated 7-like protein n=1 Tax=Nanorana parkeri TaxID=125878 RepID=UPI000854B817|nr:PREDICTED: cell division cycle-associated 7-like protein [Nanorana parkeri]